MDISQKKLRVTSVIARLTSGGIGPVCRYAAESMARQSGWNCTHQSGWTVTLLCLHDPPSVTEDHDSGLRIVGLGLDENCPREFLSWLSANPQDLIITSDVSYIEHAFPFLPRDTRHVIQIHDSGRRYRDVAVRNAAWVDGVTCVGQHIEAPLRQSLEAVGFRGLIHSVHNGANFPPLKERQPNTGPLRLLFVGRVDALKGVFDFAPLLVLLKKRGVPVILNLVGGENESLYRRFQLKGVADMVRWMGRVPHERCYDIAAESDLLLVPSRKESFGMVTVEAMSMGCVPMAYDITSGSKEIIETGRSGILVPLGDFLAWAAEIQSLHNDRPRLARLAAGAIERSRTHFSAEVMAANLTSFLREVMDRAEQQPARRKAGLPPEEPIVPTRPVRGYQRLPEGLRTWIRNRVCARPKLSYWLLNR